jgi:hypothetical protein
MVISIRSHAVIAQSEYSDHLSKARDQHEWIPIPYRIKRFKMHEEKPPDEARPCTQHDGNDDMHAQTVWSHPAHGSKMSHQK